MECLEVLVEELDEQLAKTSPLQKRLSHEDSDTRTIVVKKNYSGSIKT